MDVMFDIFGADECPPELFSSLSLMPVLEQCKASFKSRVRAGPYTEGGNPPQRFRHQTFDPLILCAVMEAISAGDSDI